MWHAMYKVTDVEGGELTRRRDNLSLLSSVFMGLLPVQLILIF